VCATIAARSLAVRARGLVGGRRQRLAETLERVAEHLGHVRELRVRTAPRHATRVGTGRTRTAAAARTRAAIATRPITAGRALTRTIVPPWTARVAIAAAGRLARVKGAALAATTCLARALTTARPRAAETTLGTWTATVRPRAAETTLGTWTATVRPRAAETTLGTWTATAARTRAATARTTRAATARTTRATTVTPRTATARTTRAATVTPRAARTARAASVAATLAARTTPATGVAIATRSTITTTRRPITTTTIATPVAALALATAIAATTTLGPRHTLDHIVELTHGDGLGRRSLALVDAHLTDVVQTSANRSQRLHETLEPVAGDVHRLLDRTRSRSIELRLGLGRGILAWLRWRLARRRLRARIRRRTVRADLGRNGRGCVRRRGIAGLGSRWRGIAGLGSRGRGLGRRRAVRAGHGPGLVRPGSRVGRDRGVRARGGRGSLACALENLAADTTCFAQDRTRELGERLHDFLRCLAWCWLVRQRMDSKEPGDQATAMEAQPVGSPAAA
jgi:hypothetical protein